MEEWRPVVGWEDHYAVSSRGRVKRTAPGTKTYPGKLLNPPTGKNGYPMAQMTDGKRRERQYVHRMVAAAFLPEPDSTTARYVAHKNGVRTDNRAENLYWATPAENQFDQVKHGTARGRTEHRRSALTDDMVKAIRQDKRAAKHIAADYGISVAGVSVIRRRLTHKHIPRQPGDYVVTQKARNFTDEQIREIRADQRPSRELAREFGCSFNTVNDIRRGKYYGHVT
jgi:hypothetical protein